MKNTHVLQGFDTYSKETSRLSPHYFDNENISNCISYFVLWLSDCGLSSAVVCFQNIVTNLRSSTSTYLEKPNYMHRQSHESRNTSFCIFKVTGLWNIPFFVFSKLRDFGIHRFLYFQGHKPRKPYILSIQYFVQYTLVFRQRMIFKLSLSNDKSVLRPFL